MFIITIVVMGIILYLTQLNSRINFLENKLNTNIKSATQEIEKSEIILENKTEIKIESNVISVIDKKKSPEAIIHQDVFAKNLAKFGIAILIIGVLFFLKYIDNQGLIGPVFKYISGLIFGVMLLSVGEYIKNKNKTYTNIIRGASFIIFYITLFVGFISFKVVSLPVTLALVVAVLVISIIISFKENEQLSFMLGVLGAYIISFLINYNAYDFNKENIIAILFYVLVLNTAIIFISLKKGWLNSVVIGFIFSWLIFVSVLENYNTKNILFIFSMLYGLQYLIVFLIQDFNNVKSKVFNIFDGIVFLTIINTIVYLSVFYKLVDRTVLSDYVGYFVALLGIFHFVIYMILRSINKSGSNLVTLTHFVISILLISVSIPLQFDGPIVTMIWFFEGIALSFLSILNDFKNKPIMYILSFISMIAGIYHMIIFGDYKNVMDNGLIFFNQNYIVWFTVFILINLIAYIWNNTVSDSENIKFKNSIKSVSFALLLIGQIMFVALTSYEINSFTDYKVNKINIELNKQIDLDEKLTDFAYDNIKYQTQYDEINSVSRMGTFMQMLLFIFMTIIYFIIGLICKNKIVRNMGIITLIITSILLLTLAWSLGPVYRIITFIGFGIALLIVSYLYISKNKKIDIVKALVIILAFISLTTNVNAKTVDIKNWTSIANIKASQIDVEDVKKTDNKNLYILPINKDVVNLSKKNDLSDIRIIDKNKNEIPYILVKSNQNNQSVKDDKVNVKILENSLTKDNKRILIIDTNREGVLYNDLYLYHDNNSTNFRKKVKVYISDTFLKASSPEWRTFEQKNTIYNYTDKENFTVEKMNINLSGISSRYLKIELIDDIDFDKNIKTNNKLSIISAEVKYLKDENKILGAKVKDYLSGNFTFDNLFIFKDVDLLDNIQRDNRTEIIYKGEIDVEEFLLKVNESDKNFNRSVVIQGTNNDIDWNIISNGNIYRIDSPVYKGEKLNIKIPVSTYKKFKVIIQDNNNKPLDILKTGQVKIQNSGILFSLNEDINISDLRLMVGNNTELSPVYDIKSIINYFEDISPKILEYDNLSKNADYVPVKKIIPFGERNKIFLNIGLIIFIIIIGIFGFFWMKKEKTNE